MKRGRRTLREPRDPVCRNVLVTGFTPHARHFVQTMIALLAIAGGLALPTNVDAQPAQPRRDARRVLPVDRIVAVVNDEVITAHDLRAQMNQATAALSRQGTPLPPRDVLERQVLERVISVRAQLQFARETGIRIDDTQLEATLSRIAQDNGMSLAALRSAVEKDGLSFGGFREEVRNEMTLARLREREVDARIVVTDGEVDLLLETETSQSASEEYNLSHILVRLPEQASPEQIRERQSRVEQAVAELRKGANFGQVSAGFSDAAEALSGGAMGWRDANRLPTLFLNAVKGLRVGELTEILRSPAGFHVLKLNDKRGKAAKVIVQQTRARHILVRTNELISETDARNRLIGLKERLVHGGADFAQLARLHSQDGSASQGGDLGWISPGDTVPDFERTMNALAPKQVSDPVKTEFGWHLIQVLDRRDEDMSNERRRISARQTLRARKSDEAYQEWVRQLRDRAYVEYRLDER